VTDLVPLGTAAAVSRELSALVGIGGAPQPLAILLRMLADEREAAERAGDVVDLVWSGPEAPGSLNRDTSVVVRELFEEATRSVLIASFVVDAGAKARAIFEPLAVRLDRGDALDVQLVGNIPRPHGDPRAASVIVAEWGTHFRTAVWPGRVLPSVSHDPRALDTGGPVRACMHAKFVVIDERVALVTSANFTDAGQTRNMEAGLRVVGPAAQRLASEIRLLISERHLARVPA
jgi:phosphatidylserine/phosphatidylglycerophosphate/cardiolipin synthase-like enzyme